MNLNKMTKAEHEQWLKDQKLLKRPAICHECIRWIKQYPEPNNYLLSSSQLVAKHYNIWVKKCD